MSKNLTKKEKDFCVLAGFLGNSAEAAYRAGFTVFPQRKAQKLMQNPKIAQEIAKIKEQNSKSQEAVTGLRRIAFGSVADAVRLAKGEDAEVNDLDLFSVSEIKYNPGKGVEIKFYDRLKALEALTQIESMAANDGEYSIYEALERSVKGAERHEQ